VATRGATIESVPGLDSYEVRAAPRHPTSAEYVAENISIFLPFSGASSPKGRYAICLEFHASLPLPSTTAPNSARKSISNNREIYSCNTPHFFSASAPPPTDM